MRHQDGSYKANKRKPTKQDRLVVFAFSLCFFLLLILVEPLLRTSPMSWIVILLVVGCPIVVINVLLPFSRWEEPGERSFPAQQQGAHPSSDSLSNHHQQ